MEDIEKKIEENVKRNEQFLDEFEKWLVKKGLVSKTINKHVSNAYLYINDYLNYYEIIKMEDGISNINMFMSDWFIRKCMWSSPTSLKEMGASLKKFYQCMSEKGYVSVNNYKALCDELKENMEYYLEELFDYDNGCYDDYL